MLKTNDVEDYLDRAATCRRWAKVISNTIEIARLHALADEYDEWVRRLRSREAPQAPRRGLPNDMASVV